ncbi:sulfurtransferase [Radiobacillus kanasensis]|uniref:sulfurtransferase n=1 Tax=Radiobacillus kanasensis TaxID=2844358 RepID=UPI001E5F2D6A|nr:sulfurtransferase [Radiobacillus kanasensis]UFU00414.1 sulfurtransferase [Radiobacillus kanasensis]
MFIILYSRTFPISGIPCIDINKDPHTPHRVMVDIRDYNVASNDMINGSISIPLAYLKRYHHEIPREEVHVIASDKIERNLGVRVLRSKGFKVTGYTLTECGCQQK